jgi:hypothetical protein
MTIMYYIRNDVLVMLKIQNNTIRSWTRLRLFKLGSYSFLGLPGSDI